jgi:hypothetical protein
LIKTLVFKTVVLNEIHPETQNLSHHTIFMARKISLTTHDAQKELRGLSKLILTCEDITLRNRYTARRSRLTQYLKHINSNVIVDQHERTIAYLRAQVNNLIGMLKEGGIKLDRASPARIEQPDETHLSWYEEVYMDSSSTSQSRSALTVASRKQSKSGDVDASGSVSETTSGSKLKSLSKRKGFQRLSDSKTTKGKKKNKSNVLDVGAGVCTLDAIDVADMFLSCASAIEENSVASSSSVDKNSATTAMECTVDYTTSTAQECPSGVADIDTTASGSRETAYEGVLVEGFKLRESADEDDDILFHGL